MVSILDEIIDKLKEATFTIPVKDVREPYTTKQPVYPMVTVEETRNSPYQQIHGKVLYTNLNYRFEIYGRDTSVESVPTSKRKVVTTIANEIDQIMRETYGMRLVGDPQMLPYSTDNTIVRYIMTYGGIIRNDTQYIYQNQS